MSITPEGGWTDPPPQEAQQRADSIQRVQVLHPSAPTYGNYLVCKVCDRGSLSSKKVFRMSGPVVAIGFILLIPSILGMLFSALLFFGVNTLIGHQSGTPTALKDETQVLQGKYSNYILTPSVFEMMPISLKETNRDDFVARLDVVMPITFDGRYYFGEGCTAHECGSNGAAWVIDKTTNKGAAVIMKYIPETDIVPSHENFELYGATMDNIPPPLAAWATKQGMVAMSVMADEPDSSDSPPPPPQTQTLDDAGANIARFIGSGFAIVLGIASFVGGLLGWLLVMRKRVLQCNVCGAVVNAS